MRMRRKRVFGAEKTRKTPSVELRRENSRAYSNKNLKNYNAATSPDDSIPIPGVTEVSSYLDDQERTDPFSRPEDAYIKQVGDEVSYALTRRAANYDMDDEDEEWLRKLNSDRSSFASLSDETFELIIDAYEKAFFRCPDEFNKPNSQVPVGCLCSEDVAAAVYGYWLKKRKRRKSALVRVFEANKVRKPRGRRKNWKKLESERRTASGTVKAVASEDAVVKEEHDDMKLAAAEEEARRLSDLAVKKRSKAQSLMTNVDLLMYRATMASRIAEAAQIRESLDRNSCD